MKILNLLTKLKKSDPLSIDIRDIITHRGMSILLRLLSPITPHITHQLWQDLSYDGDILEANWPKSTSISFKTDAIEMVIQVDGKLRGSIRIPADADRQVIENTVKADNKLQRHIAGKMIKKIIIVPNKLVNVVTGEK